MLNLIYSFIFIYIIGFIQCLIYKMYSTNDYPIFQIQFTFYYFDILCIPRLYLSISLIGINSDLDLNLGLY